MLFITNMPFITASGLVFRYRTLKIVTCIDKDSVVRAEMRTNRKIQEVCNNTKF